MSMDPQNWPWEPVSLFLAELVWRHLLEVTNTVTEFDP